MLNLRNTYNLLYFSLGLMSTLFMVKSRLCKILTNFFTPGHVSAAVNYLLNET
jgi:hypothetical protein